MTKEQRDARDANIRKVYQQTGSLKATARQTGHHRKTIRAVLRGERFKKSKEPRALRKSKLDPFKPHLRRLILDDQLTAILALEELRAMGFDGGYSIVKDYVRRIRPSKPAKTPTTPVDHPPGEEGQVDWSPYNVWFGSDQVTVHGFSFVLPFSRWQFLRFALNEQLETLIELHEQGFEEAAAVPDGMTYDNMTTVGRHVGPGEVRINARFKAWAEPYGFDIRLITPGNPKEHGSVERPFHYVENNCLKRRRFRFEDLDDLNRHAAWWCAEVANVRIHGTTRRRPIDQLQIERSFMKPLPRCRPEAFVDAPRKVTTDYSVHYETNAYSVSPDLVGRDVTVRVFAQRIEVLVEGEVEAVHTRSTERHQRFVLPEHEEAFKRLTPSRRLLEAAFLRLGDSARTYYDGLCAQRGRGAGYHIKRILRLADRHGSATVVSAMEHAARYGSYSADAVARVIRRGSVRDPAPATPPGEVPMPPDRVRRWLEGLDVEQRDLGDYDELVDREGVAGDGEE